MHQALGTGDRRENEINKVPVLLELAGQREEKDYEERNKQIKSLIMNCDKCYLRSQTVIYFRQGDQRASPKR